MANKNGHWYTDKNGNHYFVEDGQTPQEGWEASKRRKMINGGKYQVSDDGNEYRDVDMDEYNNYESDEAEFDETNDDDFGFDEEDEEYNREMEKAQEENAMMSEGEDESALFTDNDENQIKKYAERYEVPFDGLKQVIEEETQKRIDNGESVTNAKNDAMEDVLGEVVARGNYEAFLKNADDDNLNPNNSKYKDFSRSHITNAKLVDEGKKVHNYDRNRDETLSIIEYIPYGALQDGDNRKLYGVVKDYDGSDAPDIGAIVSPSLESAKEDLENQIQLAEQGSERYLKRGKWDEEWFNMLNDKEYDWDEDTKKRYSEKYGWDFSKPWEEQEHMKSDGGYIPLPKYKNEKGHIVVTEGPLKGQSFDSESDLLDHIKRHGEK